MRLDNETEKKLKTYSQETNQSKTAVVKEALAQYFSKADQKQSPYDLGVDLFGPSSSDQTDLSQTYKSRLKDKLNAKHAH